VNAIAVALAIPVFFLAIGIERALSVWKGRRVYRFEDSLTSLNCGVVQQATSIFLAAVVIGAYVAIYERFRIWEISSASWVAWILLFFGVDLAYYAFHRASHRVNALWATHVVHHQSEQYNLTTALRQSALQGAVSAAFYWPLAIIGFPPEMFVAMSTANTLYQFWIHTRLIGKLPRAIELVFNTPSHHRVHHGIDPDYIDKNYAGILIVWDRLFGTFIEEREEPRYGTTTPLLSWNPVWSNFEAWARLWHLARRTRRVSDKFRVWWAPPEWVPPDCPKPQRAVSENREPRELPELGTPRLRVYLMVHFAALGAATLVLILLREQASWFSLGWLSLWIIASTASWGALLERKFWGPPLEKVRLWALPFVVASFSISLWMALVTLCFSILSVLWLRRGLR
jgi:sterol desaturase/sphingolipid hydroxylase (fatty acid hydroxylase superfamily)